MRVGWVGSDGPPFICWEEEPWSLTYVLHTHFRGWSEIGEQNIILSLVRLSLTGYIRFYLVWGCLDMAEEQNILFLNASGLSVCPEVQLVVVFKPNVIRKISYDTSRQESVASFFFCH